MAQPLGSASCSSARSSAGQGPRAQIFASARPMLLELMHCGIELLMTACKHLESVMRRAEQRGLEVLSHWASHKNTAGRIVFHAPNLTPRDLLDGSEASCVTVATGSTNYRGPTIHCLPCWKEIGLSPSRDWRNA